MAERRAALIINVASRRGWRACKSLERLLVSRGWLLDRIIPVEGANELARAASLAADLGPKLVIAGGGDGTVNAVASALAYRPVALGIIPLGTANSFARSLGVPLVPGDAVDLLQSGSLRSVDMGKVGVRHFVNGSSIGLPAAVAASTPHLIKRWFGRLGYLGVAAYRLATHRPFRCHLVVDGRTAAVTALDVRVASGGFQGGVRVIDGAAVDDGRLVVRVLEGTSRWRLIAEWMRVAMGLSPSRHAAIEMSGCELGIATDPPQTITLDGEIGPQTPIVMSIDRHALNVISGRPTLG